MPSFESVKEELMARRAHRHGVDSGAEAQVEKLKKEYRYTPDKTGVDELINTGRTNRTLFTLAGKTIRDTILPVLRRRIRPVCAGSWMLS